MKARTPHWPLRRVKELVAEDRVLVLKTRALEFFSDLETALIAVKDTVALLNSKAFAETKEQTYDVCDIYGIRRNTEGWYLKICIDESIPEVVIISFHPLEHPLRTNGGVIAPGATKRR